MRQQLPCTECVREHLTKYGFIAKAPETLDGGSALGLKLNCDSSNDLLFRRGNAVPTLPDKSTRRQLFSICGQLVGHYPIAGWLRLACSYVKRHAEGETWADFIGDKSLRMVQEVLARVAQEDPVKGRWYVPKDGEVAVWSDASSLATAVQLEVNGCVVEDPVWLRKKPDFDHIIVSDLDAA